MKFTLAYDGRLDSASSGNQFEKKWQIRQRLAPQLEELWRVHPGLRRFARHLPKAGYLELGLHHSMKPDEADAKIRQQQIKDDPDMWIDLLSPIEVSGIRFAPLVRESLALSCSLNILFMREGQPGGDVYIRGDLDNRIKVFLDALKVPKSEADRVAGINPKPDEPIQCLLEDDSLITGLTIESTRLLSKDHSEKNFVRLVVEVDVRITQPKSYNFLFLGD